jgi:hypothetical protein
LNSILNATKASLGVLILFPAIICFFPITMQALDLELIFYARGDTYTSDMGYAVQSPGDLDGNGFPEIFVGAWGDNKIRVYNGRLNPDTLPEWIYENYSGNLCWLDDLNGDGYEELAMYRRVYAEAAYVDLYFGGENFYSKTEPDISFAYETEMGFGDDIRSADTDNDGYNELIISASHMDYPVDGAFYVYEIYESMDTIPDDSLVIIENQDEFYFVFGDCIGDINGDGYADYGTTIAQSSIPGFVAIFFGGSELNGELDLRIWSPFDDAPGVGHFGGDVVGLGDINRDGYDDFSVLSGGFPVCIFYGGNPFDTIPKILQELGETISLCGDINHDGWDDIAVGWTSYAYGSGEVFVYFGAYDMDTIPDIIMPFSSISPACYAFGKSVGPAGDFNGDGVDDLAVGADGSVNPYDNKGYLYVFAGDSQLPTPAEDEPDIPIPERHDILKQNYPNPFNNRTIIEYYLHGISEREIDISIYNILGHLYHNHHGHPSRSNGFRLIECHRITS